MNPVLVSGEFMEAIFQHVHLVQVQLVLIAEIFVIGVQDKFVENAPFSHLLIATQDNAFIAKIRESNKRVMTVRKYSFLLANSSHKYIWELYVFAKYGNFVLNIQNFEKLPRHF